jgi:hypothetical protein
LKELVQDCKGLRIARILRGRRQSSKSSSNHVAPRLTKRDDGHVPMTLADLKALDKEVNGDGDDSGDETLFDDSETSPRCSVRNERIIKDNSTRDQALQINAPLETDPWQDLASLTIQGNVAENQSLQVNYAMDRKSLLLLLELQNNNIASTRQRQVSAR